MQNYPTITNFINSIINHTTSWKAFRPLPLSVFTQIRGNVGVYKYSPPPPPPLSKRPFFLPFYVLSPASTVIIGYYFTITAGSDVDDIHCKMDYEFVKFYDLRSTFRCLAHL